MEIRRQIAIVRPWLPLLIASTLLAAAASFVISSQMPKVYEAKATLIVGQSLSSVNPNYDQLLTSQRLSETYALVATTRPILENVAKDLGLATSADELRAGVYADAPQGNTLLTITAHDGNPTRAAAIANAVADELIAASPAIQGRQAEFQASIDEDLTATQVQIKETQAQVKALNELPERTAAQTAQLGILEGRLASLRSTYAALLAYSSGGGSSLLSIIEPAVTPTSPILPRVQLNTLLAALVGLLLGAAIVFIIEYLDDAVKDSDAVREVTGLSTLGTIARMRGAKGRGEMYRLTALLYPRSRVTEDYRTLRTNIEFASVDEPIETILVTSSAPGEGKTITASNLAAVFAQAGREVLLVDADLRKPGIHAVFSLPNAQGLTTLLLNQDVGVGAITQATEQEHLRVLSSGPLPPNPAELLSSQRMRTVLDQLRLAANLIIIDAPPLQAFADAAILSSVVDGTLLVIDAGRGHRGAVRQSREILVKADANVLGVVLNRIPPRARPDHASYYGGYDLEEGPVGQSGAPKKSPTQSSA